MPFAVFHSLNSVVRVGYRNVSTAKILLTAGLSTFSSPGRRRAKESVLDFDGSDDGRDCEESGTLDASQRWKWAIGKVLEQVRRRIQRRKTVRAIGLAAFAGGVLVTLGALFIGFLLAWLEGDSLVQQHMERHGIPDLEDPRMTCMKAGLLFCKVRIQVHNDGRQFDRPCHIPSDARVQVPGS